MRSICMLDAYELLEQLGVRWFLPGEIGTVIPKAKTLVVKEQRTAQVTTRGHPVRR